MPAPKPIHSLHLSTARTWRGGENQLLLLCAGLQARGQKTTIVAPKESPLHERAREEGVATRALTIRGEVDPAGTWRLARLLRQVQPEILHLHDAHAVLPGQLAARALPAGRLAVIAHRRTVFKVRSKWKYGGRVDRVIAISAAAKEQLLLAGVPEAKVAVIHSGLRFPEPLGQDAPEAANLRNDLGLQDGDVLVAHAAALSPEKRQADLISALGAIFNFPKGKELDKVKGAEKPRVFLAIAGSGELEADLKRHVREAGLEAQVRLLGFQRDLRPLWAAADVAAFVSESEGLCTALIEAQGAGLPAVVTRAGGMVEVVAENETGLLAEVGDVNGIAAHLRRLSKDKALRAAFGTAARKRAREMFSADALADQTLALYRAVRGVKQTGA